ncbi:hypothetical protein PoB_005801500 [Plakobranchus ocellatus]|uniref:Uncharacterized protein n=1 Tax=Plakobranchus ocellatus TaxID=259542 RepID=A0AAV4CFB1_9GAST|nr:hypothetical protein PoB_005801500 [Plakobranchus ocellatus]
MGTAIIILCFRNSNLDVDMAEASQQTSLKPVRPVIGKAFNVKVLPKKKFPPVEYTKPPWNDNVLIKTEANRCRNSNLDVDMAEASQQTSLKPVRPVIGKAFNVKVLPKKKFPPVEYTKPPWNDNVLIKTEANRCR